MKRKYYLAKKGLLETAETADTSPLLLKTADACAKLGGIHPRTLKRLADRGLIKSLPLLRHKLYAAADVDALVESLRK